MLFELVVLSLLALLAYWVWNLQRQLQEQGAFCHARRMRMLDAVESRIEQLGEIARIQQAASVYRV